MIFPLALLSLTMAILAGWQRINWEIPGLQIAADHGAMMIGSFLGTVICLERCIMHEHKWWRLLPLLNGLSIIFFLAHLPDFAYITLIVGSAGLLILMCTYLQSSVRLPEILLVIGAFAWLTGNLVLYNQYAYPAAVKWWMLFLLWTILAERIALSSMLPVSRGKRFSLYALIALNICGTFLPFHWHGNEVFAISLAGLAVWLLAFDMSRLALQRRGQHRYIAAWLLLGFGWLIVTAAWLLFSPDASFAYDATLHSFFLGFVFSMVFGHVPIIFPGIIRRNLSLYHPVLYIVFVLFQGSLFIRILGDAFSNQLWRQWGGLFNGISMLLFLLFTVAIVWMRSAKRKSMI